MMLDAAPRAQMDFQSSFSRRLQSYLIVDDRFWLEADLAKR